MRDRPESVSHDDVDVLMAEVRALRPDLDQVLMAIVEQHPLPAESDDDAVQQRCALIRAARLRALRELLHQQQGDDMPSALCLSGGGIRSASFSLGVLQGLAARGWLPRFHYLSTVSGGGYTGSWLSAWIRNEGLRARSVDLPAGVPVPPLTSQVYCDAQEAVFTTLGKVGRGQDREPEPLHKLRAYSSYLSPMRGLSADALTLLAIYARNLTLYWLVLLPCIVAGLLLPRWYLSLLHPESLWPVAGYLLLVLAVLLVGFTLAYMASDLPAAPHDPDTNWASHPKPSQAAAAASARTRHKHSKPRDIVVPLVLPLLGASLLIPLLIVWLKQTPSPLDWARPLPPAFAWFGTVPSWRVALLCAVAGCALHALSAGLGGTFLRKYRAVVEDTRPADVNAYIAVCISGLLTGAGLYYLIGTLSRFATKDIADIKLLALLGTPSLMLLFWLGVTLYAGWRRPNGHEDEREWWARASACWIGPAVMWLLAFALVLFVPTWLLSMEWLKSSAPGALGAGTAMLGLLTAVTGYLSKHGPAWRERTESLATALGMRVLDLAAIAFIVLFLLALVAGTTALHYVLSPAISSNSWCCGTACKHWTDTAVRAHEMSLDNPAAMRLALAFIGLIALALIVSRRIGVNTFSLHSMYGNRLVRAYLAASRKDAVRRPHWFTGFDPQDNVAMAQLWPAADASSKQTTAPRLLHVVNVALNLVKASGSRNEWQDRKAAPFTISPLFSGSALTGYVSSKHYVGPVGGNGVSLGQAMAVSGAAASSNMGYHSSQPLALVMTLFNVRLGVWMPNPSWRQASPEARALALGQQRTQLRLAGAEGRGTGQHLGGREVRQPL